MYQHITALLKDITADETILRHLENERPELLQRIRRRIERLEKADAAAADWNASAAFRLP